MWTVPAARMKAGEEPQAHLSGWALANLRKMRELEEPFLFPLPMLRERLMSSMSMLNLPDRMGVPSETTVLGLCREAFNTWTNESGAALPDVIEACLARRGSTSGTSARQRKARASDCLTCPHRLNVTRASRRTSGRVASVPCCIQPFRFFADITLIFS